MKILRETFKPSQLLFLKRYLMKLSSGPILVGFRRISSLLSGNENFFLFFLFLFFLFFLFFFLSSLLLFLLFLLFFLFFLPLYLLALAVVVSRASSGFAEVEVLAVVVVEVTSSVATFTSRSASCSSPSVSASLGHWESQNFPFLALNCLFWHFSHLSLIFCALHQNRFILLKP